jgi:hypothetical protein
MNSTCAKVLLRKTLERRHPSAGRLTPLYITSGAPQFICRFTALNIGRLCGCPAKIFVKE